MPITVNWFNEEKTILRYYFEGDWTWADMDAAIARANALLASVDHRVDVLIDIRASQWMPSDGALSYLRRATLNAADNWGMGVFVGLSPLMQATLGIFARVYRTLGARYAAASSVAEAVSIIERERVPH